MPLCRICLRSGFVRIKDIDDRLSEFHDELCDYDVFVNSTFTICPICEHQLKKFYNFKQKCRRAHRILKSKRSEIRKNGVEGLHKLMPPDSIGLLTPKDRQGIFYYAPTSILPNAPVDNESGKHLLLDCNNRVPTPEPILLTSDTVKSAKETKKLISDSVKLAPDTQKLISDNVELAQKTDKLTAKTEKRTTDSDLIKTEYAIDILDPLIFIEDIRSVQDNEPLLEFKEELDNSEGVSQLDEGVDADNQYVNEETLEDFMDSDDDDNDDDDDNEKPLTKTIKQDKPPKKHAKNPKGVDADNEYGNDFNVETLDDLMDSDDDNEKPLSKIISQEKPTKKHAEKPNLLSVNDLLEEFSDSDLDIRELRHIVKDTKSKTPLENVAILAEEISLDDLKLLSKSLCKSDRTIINMQRAILQLKEHVVNLIDQGKLDLGENVTLTKESFLDMFAKCDKSLLRKRGIFKKGEGREEKLKKFLLFLLKKYNPEYETVFSMEYLTTHAMKLAEFQARRHSKEYVTASFKCDKCFKGFDLKSLLDYHNNWHDPSRPHACGICEMRFTGRKHLNMHARTSHYSLYRCKLCEVHTYSFDSMVNHYNQHKGVRYTCDVCLGEYSSKSCLNTHRLTHATHSCPHCARHFVSQNGLNNHIKLKHQGVIPSETPSSPQRASCDKCDATFKSRDSLYSHKKIIHSGYNNLFKCRFAGCLQHFSSAAELREHSASLGHVRRCPPDAGRRRRWSCPKFRPERTRINVTGPDIPYRTCPICEEKVPNKFPTSLYKHHLAAHPSEHYEGADARVSLCEHCGKSFVHRSIYRDHLNTHTGARPYACRECGARFHMRRALYLHRDQHGPPRHQCKECGKMFRTAANLFTHRRTHIGDRRFKCDICFKGFLHAGSLKEHINGVHNQIRRVKKSK